MTEVHEGAAVVPGDRICPISGGMSAGAGAYIAGSDIFASVVGLVRLQSGLVSVVRSRSKFAPLVPQTGSVVLAKVPEQLGSHQIVVVPIKLLW